MITQDVALNCCFKKQELSKLMPRKKELLKNWLG